MSVFQRETLSNGVRLLSAPIESSSWPICCAVGRRSVPLKNMCSAKCAIPLVSGVSKREPAASMMKHATDWTCGIGAERRRTPFDSVSRWMTLKPAPR